LDVGYPIFSAAFVSENTFAITGGGGEGKNGVANKITILKIEDKDQVITECDEFVLSKSEDSPMSLDVSKDGLNLVAGVNCSSDAIRAGENEHLRLFDLRDERISAVSKSNVFKTTSLDSYQKCTRFSQSSKYLAIASSMGVISNLRFPSLSKVHENIVDENEIQDVDYSLDEHLLAYSTEKHIQVLSAGTGKKLFRIEATKERSFRSIKFVKSEVLEEYCLIVISNFAQRSGAAVERYRFTSDTKKLSADKYQASAERSKLNKTVKAVTSMACSNELVAVAGADLTIRIIRLKDLREIRVFKNVHSFSITRLVFSPAGDVLVSTSVANSVAI
ncbi:quinon protein alcohol dehydrogenase-like superfamily, partial [Dipodascopsis tothii]|uniref:quinon protein alcohol dehydrogenase-like superfamily n=1 Tax=Dipodascopsis tothii TaxID=44089 RepID=UPI0034CF92CE